MSMPSLRTRLLAWLLAGMALAWLVMALLSYRAAMHELDEVFDANLAQAAHTLLRYAGHEPVELAEHERMPPTHLYEHELAFQLSLDGQGMVLRSALAPVSVFPLGADGYANLSYAGRDWRTFRLHDARTGVMVVTAQPRALRDELARTIAWRFLAAPLVMLPLLALYLAVAVRRGLAPLDRLAAEVAARDARDLTALDDAAQPREVRPLLAALNTLFGRVGAAVENERRFTADAAHELRTPLAAIRVQAEVASLTHDEAARQTALAQVIAGVDRTTHLTAQLLNLAHLDPQTGLAQPQPVVLAKLVMQLADEFAPVASARGITLRCTPLAQASVIGDADLLRLLLRNLLDNALSHTPRGGVVEVSVSRDMGAVLLSVADSGSGIAPECRTQVFERFYRVPGSPPGGSGLGLSIVQRVAELHSARITLGQAALGGLLLQIRFN